MENHDISIRITMILGWQLGRISFNKDIYINIRPLSENPLAEHEKTTFF
jgi:hypothetical protein